LEEGQVKLNPEATHLEQFLTEVYELARGLPWVEAVDFRLDLAKSLPQVNLDTARIRQVVLNLLTNAQKFTQHGSVTLSARSLPQQTQAQISVSDTGPGIPADQLEQIFERFWQAQQPLELRQRGAGLGLAICRELVERHGGQIWAESAPGAGATFTFSLPIAGPAAR
jgi:signal transduction histidine kinase